MSLPEVATWGGRRKGAGRKKSKTRKDPVHRARPEVSRNHPQHVVLRTLKEVGRLRCGKVYRALRKTLRNTLGQLGFSVVHLSIQHNHLHLIVEAGGKTALRLGMQGLAISAAKAINRACKRKGKVFEYRYHATALRSPKQARNALAYVINNWRRHNEDERTLASRFAAIDPYSTARSFKDWKNPSEAVMPHGFSTFIPLDVAQPRTWLLREGWKRSKCGSCGRGTGLERKLDNLTCYACSPRRASSSARVSSMSSHRAS